MTLYSHRFFALLLIASSPLVMGADSCFDDPQGGPCTAEEANECAEMGGVFNNDTCGCCVAGAHEVHECEVGLEGTFNWQTCECEPNCDPDEAAECENTHGVYNHVECTCCHAGAHQVQACELGEGGTFNWLTCECDVTCEWNSDCPFGFECDGGACVESECHETSHDGSLPALDCPEGFGCEYGDGVDFNHGNGYCVEVPCTYNSDCRWGFECRGRLCVESACHIDSPDGALPARYCDDGYGCEYGDGVDFNHGNGYCVPDPSAAPGSRSTDE